MMTGKLAPLLILLAGCCHAPVDHAIGLPPRPHLEPLEAELQADIPAHALKIIAGNDSALKEYAKRLESRIRLHDERL